jgi:RNA polymerase sigma-70 factor (ECF subfamily)
LEDQEKKTVASICNGDKNAFEFVFKAHYQHLCAYANQIVNDLDIAEEIVQEMFYQLWQKRDSLSIKISLKSYLFRAIHNSCLNHLKHNKVKQAYSQQVLYENNDPSNNHYNLDDSTELIGLIRRAVDKLPPERKKVFMMIRYEDRKYKEVAEILGISVKTVENQMGAAMKFLREALKEYMPSIALITLILENFLNSNR